MLLSAIALTITAGAQPTAATGTRRRSAVIMSADPGSRQNEEEWGYADAIAVGNTIYVSGVVASLRPGERDYQAAYVRLFDEVGARLKRLGSSWDDVVDILSFHTDLVSQMPVIAKVKQQYVSAPYPAWTAVGVTRLGPGSGITEVRVTAIRSRGAHPADPGGK